VQNPELISSLFLFEPVLGSVVIDPAAAEVMAQDRKAMLAPCAEALGSGDLATAVELLIDGVSDLPGTFSTLLPDVRAALVENARILPLMFAAPPPPLVSCAQLARIGVPVVIARGEFTRFFYRIVADAINHCIPGSRLMVVPHVRHMWPLQDPAAFNDALVGFLNC
jgi:pimeloyl-ACP methyl ester carboxylesterase